LDDRILMSKLQDSPVLHAPFPIVRRTLLLTLETLLSAPQTSNTNNSTTQQCNILALLVNLFRQASAVNIPSITSPKTPSPLDDIENVAGITVYDENAEIKMDEESTKIPEAGFTLMIHIGNNWSIDARKYTRGPEKKEVIRKLRGAVWR
jgi:hypothetical protein